MLFVFFSTEISYKNLKQGLWIWAEHGLVFCFVHARSIAQRTVSRGTFKRYKIFISPGYIHVCTCILKQKSLATHHRIRILITEFHVEINTNLIRLVYSKCDFNLIQYQIMPNFICMERSACHKMLFKRTQCQYFEHSPCASETVPDNYDGHSRTRDSS